MVGYGEVSGDYPRDRAPPPQGPGASSRHTRATPLRSPEEPRPEAQRAGLRRGFDGTPREAVPGPPNGANCGRRDSTSGLSSIVPPADPQARAQPPPTGAPAP